MRESVGVCEGECHYVREKESGCVRERVALEFGRGDDLRVVGILAKIAFLPFYSVRRKTDVSCLGI